MKTDDLLEWRTVYDEQLHKARRLSLHTKAWMKIIVAMQSTFTQIIQQISP